MTACGRKWPLTTLRSDCPLSMRRDGQRYRGNILEITLTCACSGVTAETWIGQYWSPAGAGSYDQFPSAAAFGRKRPLDC
jgi:hypothetical protein